jgi:hypothetical protein
MAETPRLSTAGIRLHQFAAGALPVMAYLAEWLPPVYIALGLSFLATISPRVAVLAFLARRTKHAYEQEDPGPIPGLVRLDEVLRAIFLGAGAALLLTGHRIGWLPILGAATVSVLEGTTAFSFTLLLYTWLVLFLKRLHLGTAPTAEGNQPRGNPNCLICQTLQSAPYGRCRWCRLTNVRWCCGLQTSLLMILLLVIAFLLTAQLEPLVTKLLVTMSIIGLVALSLAFSRQTDDLIGSLNHLDDAQRRTQQRCEFLKGLVLSDSIRAAAETVVAHASTLLNTKRISVMVIEDGMLRIAASQGIPDEVAARVAVPVPERLCGWVFSRGTPVVLTDIAAQSLFETLGLSTPGSVACYPLAAALATASRRVGVINVTDHPSGPFSPDDLAELQFVAEASAISLASQMDRRDLEQANYAAIRSLALAIEAKDPYTHGHSQRVQQWATMVAKALGLSGARLQTLSYAAELHDIGKLAIPDEILKAPRRLTPEEWAIIQEHPRRGVELVRHLTFLKPAYGAILHHHERFDGKGYPERLADGRIPLEARILAVIDAYDAMTSMRSYRPALSHEEAVAELHRGTGTQFDPECVRAFLCHVEGQALPAAAAAGAEQPC